MEASGLAQAWFFILALVFLLYLLSDGYDLGVGILTLLIKDDEFIENSMNSLLGLWHANQTWLVIFGAVLFGAFPAAYGLLLSALYLPIALLFLGIIMRGIGLEYYYYAGGSLKYRQAFSAGSLLTSAAQGLGVGVVLTGLPLDPKGFSGGVWEWVNPLSIILAFSLPCWYALLGAAGIAGRVKGKTREFGRKASRAAAYLSLATGIVLILWGLVWKPFWARDWLAWPGLLSTLLPILLGALVFAPLIKGLSRETKNYTFQFTILAVCLIFAGLIFGLHPYLVWPKITIAAAAATPAALKFMLIGIGAFFPFIVFYNAYIYRVFWRMKENQENDPS